MSSSFDRKRLARLRPVLNRHIDDGSVAGMVALVHRGEDTHVEALGNRTTDAKSPVSRDTIFRISSMSKPIVATAAMILIEECRMRLDDPVDELLPELANRRVLKKIDGPLSATTASKRSVTIRDLLTLRLGFGYIVEPKANAYPIMKAANRQGVLTGPLRPQTLPDPDTWLKRVAKLPLMRQPGTRWMYEFGFDVLGVLIARAAGQPLAEYLRERLFEPLGMVDTAFFVPPNKLSRFTDCYQMDAKEKKLTAFDSIDGQWSEPPAFESGASGLVSTADDCLNFQRMLLQGGRHGQHAIVSRASVDLMTTNQLTPGQREGAEIFLGENLGWGMGFGIVNRRDDVAAAPGRFGWDGGLGSSAWSDKGEGLTGILLTNRMSDSPGQPPAVIDFWTTTYQAVN